MSGYEFDNELLLAACAALAVLIGLTAGLLMGLSVVLLDGRGILRWKTHRASALRP
jgi:hypothetical protein